MEIRCPRNFCLVHSFHCSDFKSNLTTFAVGLVRVEIKNKKVIKDPQGYFYFNRFNPTEKIETLEPELALVLSQFVTLLSITRQQMRFVCFDESIKSSFEYVCEKHTFKDNLVIKTFSELTSFFDNGEFEDVLGLMSNDILKSTPMKKAEIIIKHQMDAILDGLEIGLQLSVNTNLIDISDFAEVKNKLKRTD